MSLSDWWIEVLFNRVFPRWFLSLVPTRMRKHAAHGFDKSKLAQRRAVLEFNFVQLHKITTLAPMATIATTQLPKASSAMISTSESESFDAKASSMNGWSALACFAHRPTEHSA
jgi:hypothetical protein